MKISGLDPKTLPTEEVLILPRGDQFVKFTARGLQNMDTFNTLCPEPKCPGKLTRDGYVPDSDDQGFKDAIAEYAKRRLAYLVVATLAPSDIEWDTVKLDTAGTWANWETDLKGAGFTQVECNLVLRLVMEANALDEAKLRKARDVFLRGPHPVSA